MTNESPYPEKNTETVQEKAFDRLAHFIKNADIYITKGSKQINGTLTAKNEEQYVSMKLLLDLAGIYPWEDNEKMTLDIGGHDIALLIELGIMDASTLLPEEQDIINRVVDDEMTQKISKNTPFSKLEKIPDLFKENSNVSPFADMSEPEAGVEKYFSHGNTSYLYNEYRRKYRRETGGVVFRKTKINGRIVETEISKEEQAEILKRAQNGDEKARNEYLIMNIGLVYLVALNFNRKFPRINLADLLQEGMIIMNNCITRYDPNHSIDELIEGGVDEKEIILKEQDLEEIGTGTTQQTSEPFSPVAKFSTFVIQDMQWRFLKEIGSERLIYIPDKLKVRFSKISKLIADLEKNTEGQISQEDIIKKIFYEFAISEVKARELYDSYLNFYEEKIIDIDATEDTVDESSLIDESQNPVKDVLDNELENMVDTILKTITPRERKVLSLRFGINPNNQTNYTLEEIGSFYKTTFESVRQIEAKAIRKMRHPSRSDVFRKFTDGTSAETHAYDPLQIPSLASIKLDQEAYGRLSADRTYIENEFESLTYPKHIENLTEDWIRLFDDTLRHLKYKEHFSEEYENMTEKRKMLLEVAIMHIKKILEKTEAESDSNTKHLHELLLKYKTLYNYMVTTPNKSVK